MAKLSEHGIRLSSMSPSFLNSNSTSHTWPFSAVAELVDNASDPGVYAKQMWIDLVEESGHLCLTFTDNGCGMTPNKLHKMLSFGFTEKGSSTLSQMAIGVYGNGFKSGSMRLGRDALIFTKNGGCQSVGLLSQTYLEKVQAQAVIVPIVPFSQQTNCLVKTEDSDASLSAILQNSIVNSLEKIHAHFDSIPSKKGTKIVIWNIRRGMDGKTEIDFESNEADFCLPQIQIQELMKDLKGRGTYGTSAELNITEIQYSLREYLSILYLKPRTQIILRGKKVMAKLISKRLMYIEHDVYNPQFSKDKVKVTFGLIPKKKNHYGMMMYHKNRLIKAYEKVGCQLKGSGLRGGVGVIGVIECNFLKPAHNKQDFQYTKEYRLTLSALGIKLNEYWRMLTEKQAKMRAFNAVDGPQAEEETLIDDGPLWLQCEECLKWRSIPCNYYDDIPEMWHCSQNPSRRYRSCSAPEEMDDTEELVTASYQKANRKPKNYKSKRREKLVVICEKLSPEELAKHKRPSFRPPEPAGSAQTADHVSAADGHQTEEDAVEEEAMDADGLEENDAGAEENTRTQQTPERETLIGGTTQEEPSVEILMAESENTEANMEKSPEEQSNKRKAELFSDSINKKTCHQGAVIPGAEHRRPSSEMLSSDTPWQDGSGLELKPTDASPRPTGPHSASSTQTVGVSPLGQAENATPPPQESAQVSIKQRLAQLENEAQKLRQLLGLEATRTSQGTMTTTDLVSDLPEELQAAVAAAAAAAAAVRNSREVGCQTDAAESSASPCCLIQPPACQLVVDCAQKPVTSVEQLEQSKAKTKDCDDGRLSTESLRSFRQNVATLLTVLLPQLDITEISLESNDVDNVLQQVIDVNSLRVGSELDV